MSIQTIVANSETFNINDHRIVGSMLSRNLRITTSEILSTQPFVFQFKPNDYMSYSKNRSMLSALRTADRISEQTINLGTTGWKNIIAYQGEFTSTYMNAGNITALPSTGKTLNLRFANVTIQTVGIKIGDFIQWGRYAYIATENKTIDVGSQVNVSVGVHRTIMDSPSVSSSAAIGEYGVCTVGGVTYVGVTFPVIVQEYPTYTLKPITNDSFISWDGPFKVIENINT